MNTQVYKWFVLLLVVLSWASCANKNEYEVVDSEEILPQSQGQYDYTEDTLVNDEFELSSQQEVLMQSVPGISFEGENSLKESEMLFMPDRLGYKEKNEIYFTKDSIPFHFLEWSFEDSLKTVNAFYNWIDCFGHDCRSIRIDEKKNGTKEAFVIWVSNTQISCIASTKSINRKTWQEAFFNNEKNTWNYIIHQGPRGKMTWVVSTTMKGDK